MKSQGRILIIDDLASWRDILSRTLQAQGFETQTASSISEALNHLMETDYHLLVLDIRLDEMKESDEAGMDFLRQLADRGLGSALHVIMLSAYGTPAQMRAAFRDFHVVDFMAKEDFDNAEFSKQVQHTFQTKVDINYGLNMTWQDEWDSQRNLSHLRLNGHIVQSDPAFLERLDGELEDLLKRIFHRAESIRIKPLTPGFSGASVLQVQPSFADRGVGQPVVVKFGDYRKIEQEYKNFEKFVQPFVGGGRCTTIRGRGLRRTSRLGGIAYSLLGAANEQIEDFRQFYQRATIEEIKAVFDNLFQHTCIPWYEAASAPQMIDLTETYMDVIGMSLSELDQLRVESLPNVVGQVMLQFEQITSDERFVNPVLAVDQASLVCESSCCITHGDLNHTNVWVDADHHTWLIDFQHTSTGHLLRDVVMLDSIIRFQLLPPDAASLDERLAMERVLVSVSQPQDIDTIDVTQFANQPHLSKAFQASLHLRSLAAQLKVQTGGTDYTEYHIAVFYRALNTIRFLNLSETQREHAVLSASLLVDHLPL